MAATKKSVANLIRKAGQDAKKTVVQEAGGGGVRSSSDNIYDILTYIEADWGLDMRLYPAQRTIVKLYHHIELDDKIPENPSYQIKIRDFLTGEIRYTLSEKDYVKFLYEEGRCNIGEQDHVRRELLLAIGRRGGKCVTGDTLVPTDKGIFRIEDLAEAPEEETSIFETLVAQESGAQAKSSHFYNGGIKPTFDVQSKSGLRICGTGNHRVKIMTSSGKVDWCYLDSIQPGDYLAVNRSSDLWASDLVDVTPYHNSRGYKELSFPDTLNARWGLLLGYLVGDGSWTGTQGTSITVEHPETWENLKSLFDELFGGYRTQLDPRTENTGRIEFPSVGMRQFLNDLGWVTDCSRDSKSIPWSILRSPKPVVCAFLRGLFETDGCAEGAGRKITFSSASFRLAHEVQTLLLNLGIFSGIRRKWNQKTKRHYANLTLKGLRSRRAFARLIGFDSEKKQGPLLAALETAQEGKSSTESLPHQYQRVRALLETVPKRNPAKGELGWGRSKLRQALGNTCKPSSGEDLTYSRLAAAIRVAEDLGSSGPELEHFKHLLDLDYVFDPVESVQESEDQVYDLSVPDGAMFVANGLTNHNTLLSSIFASYEIYRLLNLNNPQEYYGLPNGDRIQVISVATDKDQASILFNNVAGQLAKCDYFAPYQANNTQSEINFRTPYDIEKFGDVYRENGKFASFNGKASLRLTFRGATGKGLRGSGNVVIILDEFAHFLETGPTSAAEIYKAVTPSAAAFSPKDPNDPTVPIGSKESRVICISSPLGKSGKFYELYDQAMRNGQGAENMLAIQAPTWEINPTVPLQDLRQAYYADAKSFSVEYGAEFNDTLSGWIERAEDLQACITDRKPTIRAQPKVPHQMGIDVGLVGDGTCVVISHVQGPKIVLDYHEMWVAKTDWRESNPHLDGQYSTDYAKSLKTVERLDFDEISKWIRVLAKRFHIRKGLFDRWNGIPLEQALHKVGLKQFESKHFARDESSKMFQAVKMMMYDEALDLYDYPIPLENQETGGGSRHSPYISELLSLRAKMVSKNICVVEAPADRKDLHDDFADALVRSVWLSIEQMTSEKHTSHGYGFGNRPRAATSVALHAHQMARARLHGVGPRAVPKGLSAGRKLRYTR